MDALDITYWAEVGGRPLTAPEIDGNFRSLADAIQALQTSGVPVTMIDRIEQDPVASTVTIYLTSGAYFGPYPLPSRPINPKGARIAGAQYVAQDVVTDGGSAYLALKSFGAKATVELDLAAGNVMLLVAKGRDAQTNKGTYNPALSYVFGDVVSVVPDPAVPFVYDAFQAFDAIPVGYAPSQGYPWGRLVFRPARDIEKTIDGKPSASQTLRFLVNKSGIYLPPSLSGSRAALVTPPSAAWTVAINKRAGGPGGPLTNLGSIAFAAGAAAGTFALTNPTILQPGDVLEFVCPSSVDANAAGLLLNVAAQFL